MPRNRLALPVRVGGQQQLIHILELGLKIRHLFLLIWAHHI